MNCFTCSKYFLVFFNFIFWLSGGLLLALGIWLKVDPSILEKVSFIEITGADQFYLSTAAIIMITVGAIVTVVGFFGCCGAIRESKCLLGMYISFLVLIILIEIAVGVLGVLMLFVYKAETEDILRGGMLTAMDSYGKDDEAVTKGWDFIQQEFVCCGTNGPIDWENKTSILNLTVPGVPYSCCVHGETFDKDNQRYVANNYTVCQKEAGEIFKFNKTDVKYVYKNGCYGSIQTFLTESSITIAAVGLGIALLEIFGLVLACCVCCQINKGTYSYNNYD